MVLRPNATIEAGHHFDKVTAVASTNPRIAATLAPVKEGEKYAVNIRPTDTTQPETAEVFVQTDFPPEGPKAYTIHVRVK